MCQEVIVIKIRLYWAYLEINSTNCIQQISPSAIYTMFQSEFIADLDQLIQQINHSNLCFASSALESMMSSFA